jgi:pyrimidine-nucleoside phosphorylase
MNTPELIRRKREGAEIPAEEIKEFIDGYVAGKIPDYQVSAFLMAVFFRGMAPREAAALTRSMLESGERFDLSSINGPKVDKHSTGGVGDKVSLILAPLVASAGGVVPMVSGRGLGHSGGTLDKLDAIPGYRWNLTQKEFKKQLDRVGCAIIGQTEKFVPADKKLYSLRDVTATVECVPLICASILSKKAAAGTGFLVMDVKCGSGAFMENLDRARELATGLVSIGTALGMKVSAMLTQMSQPMGITVGNALEVRETIDLLKGEGPADAREITLQLCAEMLVLAKLEKNRNTALAFLAALLDSGKALEKAVEWIEAQGGDARFIDKPALLGISKETAVIKAKKAGVVSSIQTRDIGVAGNLLGAGRIKTTDIVDTTVGLEVYVKPGDKVEKGQPLVTVYHRRKKNLAEATRLIENAIVIGSKAVKPLPLILEEIRK